MIFEKDGVRYSLTDATHIEAFEQSGWRRVEDDAPPKRSTRKTKDDEGGSA